MPKPRIKCSCRGNCRRCLKRASQRMYAKRYQAKITGRARIYRSSEPKREQPGRPDSVIDAESLRWLETKVYGANG